ncbi:aminodeoxychorismate lyase [Clostridia bacterium]|nr:aminodeoxychorismate lyase [Clostridia bacterium]
MARYHDDENEERAPQPRRITTGCLTGVLYAVAVIAVSLALALFGWNSAKDVLGLLKDEHTATVVIPEGYTLPQVARILKDKGLIENSWLFSFYADFSDAEKKIKAGTYELRSTLDYHAMVNALRPSGTSREEIRLTIPEGYNLRQIIAMFDEKKVATTEELWKAAEEHDYDYKFLQGLGTPERKNLLEGYLYPDTYDFFIDEDPVSVFQKMLRNFNRKLTPEYKERVEELGYTMEQVIIIASIVEKEAANDEERNKIASVIYNRLKKPDQFPTLGIDATIQYLLDKPHVNLTEAELNIDSPYNTRLNPGLPPGPICSPGQNSIRAALYPESTSYYYYVLSPDGHVFCKTAAEFEKAKKANQDYINSLG